jgi:hypothetical protein
MATSTSMVPSSSTHCVMVQYLKNIIIMKKVFNAVNSSCSNGGRSSNDKCKLEIY